MPQKIKFNHLLSDIRFWIIVLFLIRLIGITNAPLETGHNWRQALTNTISRNFVEQDANILYPRIDMAGEKTGIIGSEFPFFNYLNYLFSLLFGYTHWAGRLINLIVSSIGLYFFYLLVKARFNKPIAFNAVIILGVSIWFAYSRKIMPDTFSVSLMIIGLYFAHRYLISGSKLAALLFFAFGTLGMLCKIPALTLLSGMAILPFIKEVDRNRKIIICLLTALSLVLVYSWYFVWVPHLVKTYQFQLFFPKGLLEGIKEISPLVSELLKRFYFTSLHSYIAFALFLAGIVLFVKNEKTRLKFALLIVSLVFSVFILKTGSVFPLHTYYIIPFTPIMAFLSAYGLSKIPSKFQYIVLLLISAEAIANQQHDFFIKDNQRYKLTLEDLSNQYIPKNELIIINGGQSHQPIYFSHRKGWTTDNASIMDTHFVDSLKALGAKHLIIDKHLLDQQLTVYTLQYSDEHYAIYDLED